MEKNLYKRLIYLKKQKTIKKPLKILLFLIKEWYVFFKIYLNKFEMMYFFNFI